MWAIMFAAMHATVASRRLLLASALAVVAVLSSCGSSKPDPSRVARLVAETNALCTSMLHRAHPSATQKQETQHRLAVLVKSLSEAAAYLPAGRSFNEARAKRRVLSAETAETTDLGVAARCMPPPGSSAAHSGGYV
jgi:hypothetical protein